MKVLHEGHAERTSIEKTFPRDPRCDKLRYPTERSARQGVKELRRKGREGYGYLHAYLCPTCKHWHVGHRMEY